MYRRTILLFVLMSSSIPLHTKEARSLAPFTLLKEKAHTIAHRISSYISRNNVATMQLICAIALPIFCIARYQFNHMPVRKHGNCGVCLDTKDRFFILPCGHEYCVECLQGIVDQALQHQSTALLRCPEPKCRKAIINDLLGAPNIFDALPLRKLQEQAYKAWKINHTEADPETKKVTRPCPHCKKRIFRDGGCNHMYCDPYAGGCSHEFCWLCGDDYHVRNDHYIHGTNKKCSKKIFGE